MSVSVLFGVVSGPAGGLFIEKPLSCTETYSYDYYYPQTYVATLTRRVPATAGSTTCFIPADVPSNALSLYVPSLIYTHSTHLLSLSNLRFITTSPPSIVYTADFSILGGTGDPVYPLSAEEDDDPTADNDTGDTQDPNTTPDSTPNDPQDPTDPTITDPNSPDYKDPNTQPNSTDSSTSGPPPAVSTIIAPPLGKGDVGSPAPTPTPTTTNSGTPRLPYNAAVRSDLESLGFRTAIVLWPAVIGISMAL